MSKPKWLEIIVEGYEKDEGNKKLLNELASTSSNDQGFSLKDGLVRYKGRIWLGKYNEAHKVVLLALHDNDIGGHSRITATYHKIKALFAWPSMKKNVQL